MPTENPLDLYQTAYLVGGARQAALVAVLSQCEAGLLVVSPARHRVKATTAAEGAVAPPGEHAVAHAVLAAVPATGVLLGALIDAVSLSPEMDAVRLGLIEGGLLQRWQLDRPTRRGKQLRRTLHQSTHTGLGLVAVSGPEAIADDGLRKIFTTPDPAGPPLPSPNRNGRGPGEQSNLSDTSYGGL